MARRRGTRQPLNVESLTHEAAGRTNIPSAEHQPLLKDDERHPIEAAFERRNPDLDPQLVWRGKDPADWSDLVTQAPPLYIQEKVSPKALIDDLRRSGQREAAQLDFFADFNGLPEGADRTDFYQHQANWSNRMILGDSLQVMASLAEREGLRGQVQCIYIDPPYGIKFNSNFQWSTTSRDVKDGKAEHITREPEQVKAFRDTWRDGIHSYLTYLRDRLIVARDLLSESGSIFVQIGDENVHRVRAVMDEVFGEGQFLNLITFLTTTGRTSSHLPNVSDYILWYAKNSKIAKYRALLNIREKDSTEDDFELGDLTSQGASSEKQPYHFQNEVFFPSAARHWSNEHILGMPRLAKSGRIVKVSRAQIRAKRFLVDRSTTPMTNRWSDTQFGAFARDKVYVVQTTARVIQRCILMTTDPGDLVLDPTCGSGTSAYVSEQWGRRWITIDTSRVALALARARVMGARYPWYLLADSPDGQRQEAERSGRDYSLSTDHSPLAPTHNDIRQGFVYQRVAHVTLREIANNAEIDVIWERLQPAVEAALADLNQTLRGHPTPYQALTGGREGQHIDFSAPDGATVTLPSGESAPANGLLEWDVPREAPADWPAAAGEPLAAFWEARIARQQSIDASIAAKAEFEYLYDKPYEDRRTVRVAGPFTVESLSPHRMLGVDEHGELIDRAAETPGHYGEPQDFATIILDQLRTAGVQQAHKQDRIAFDSLTPWPGEHVCAEGRYQEGGESGAQKRAGILIGPEFGTVQRGDLVAAAREAAESGFDLLIACAFNYEAHATDFDKLGGFRVLKARMNADLHMSTELKNTGQGNLFVIFGEPDIVVASEEWLVDGLGKRVAPYDIFKLVSGVDCLAEVNRLSRDDVRAYAEISCRREVWDYLTDQARGIFGTGQHRGGTGATNDGGVSSVAWHRAGLPGGTGNLSDFVQKAGAADGGSFRNLIERLRGDQPDAQRADQGTRHSALITDHSRLTTDHWTQVTVRGVDVFDPSTGEVRSDDTDGIACWFVDTDYDSESFFVRHAYFLGANDPYKALKTTLKAEIDADAWATLRSDTSRPFPRPASGRIAVKVINHLGDEVLKVFRVD